MLIKLKIPCQIRIFKFDRILKKTLTFILTCLDKHFVTVNVVEGKVFIQCPN